MTPNRIGRQQRRILKALYYYSLNCPCEYVLRRKLINHLGMGESTFSRAIERLAWSLDSPSLVETGSYGAYLLSVAGRKAKLTEEEYDALIHTPIMAMRAFYRITDHGVEHFDDLVNSRPSRHKPRTIAPKAGPGRPKRTEPKRQMF